MDQSEPLLLVTGAQGGIGAEVARQALQAGWSVARVSRRSAAVPESSPRALDIAADVSTAEGADAAYALALSHFGRAPAYVCHAAGAVRLGAIERVSDEQWRQTLSANLDAAFYTLRAHGRANEGAGAALLFSSVAARMGTPSHVAVAAAKAGVEGMVRALAADWSPRGLRINAVALGLTETPMTESFTRGERARAGVTAQYPLGRLGRATEAAAAALYLLGPEAGWITGQILSVDGGFSAVRPLVRPTT